MRKIQILVLLAVVTGAAWLTTLVDDGLGDGWVQVVVRNWEQFGFSNLHGKLVFSPGGFEAESHPKLYAGHRPASLLPVFLCHHLLAAGDKGFLVYYGIMAAIVLLAIWQLLGRTERAFWLAAIVVLTPGYLRWQTSVDPNLTAVLFGFPFCAIVLNLLQRPVLKWAHWAVLFLLVLIFTSINWTTIFVHAMLLVTLLLLPRIAWRQVFFYAGLIAVIGGLVLLTSVASKMTTIPSGTPGNGLARILTDYGWGNSGYGFEMGTKTACLRLFAANLMGLLPMLIFFGWQFWRRGGCRSAGGLVFLAPFLVSVVEVMGLRNYFGHHPWMSIHFILMGIILSAVLWKARHSATVVDRPSPRLAFRLACLAVTFVYSFTVLTAYHRHNEQELNLVGMIRAHTDRDTTIVIRLDTDPALKGMDLRLPELFDRHVVVVSDSTDANLADVPAKRLFLTTVPPVSGKILGQTGGEENGNPVMKKLLDWYSHYIAHRRPGDKLDLSDKFFLYQPSS